MPVLRLLVLLLLLSSGNMRMIHGQDSIVHTEFIFQVAPFASAHASTITQTNSGLVAAWFGGTAEGNADDIVGGRNGEVRGAMFVDGVIGQAFWCDGNDYIHVNDPGPEGSADLDLTAQATFTGFIHPTAYRQRRYHYQQGKLLRNRRLR